MKVCIRVDDIGWTAETAFQQSPCKQPDRALSLARRFHRAMLGRPYLAGIIPRAVDEAGREWLRTRPVGMTFAQHGTSHRLAADMVRSEYRDMTGSALRDYVAVGHSALGVPTEEIVDFIPPFNALEPELPDALYLEGFRRIWGAPSRWSTPPQPQWLGRCLFVPAWMPLYGATLWRMQAADRPLIEVWPEVSTWPGYAVLTLHVPWEAAKDGWTLFDGVRRLVGLLGDAILSPSDWLKCSTLS